MAMEIKIKPNRTYATRQNAEKAVAEKNLDDHLRYMILITEEGRFFPAFIGREAVVAGVHFHFTVVC